MMYLWPRIPKACISIVLSVPYMPNYFNNHLRNDFKIFVFVKPRVLLPGRKYYNCVDGVKR